MGNALDTAAQSMGVQPEQENLFDDSRSADIAARYAGQKGVMEATDRLAAARDRQQAQQDRDVARQRADQTWDREQVKLNEEDQYKVQRGEFLTQIAALDPTADDYLEASSKIKANLPENAYKDPATESIFKHKDYIFQRREADKIRDENTKAVREDAIRKHDEQYVTEHVMPELTDEQWDAAQGRVAKEGGVTPQHKMELSHMAGENKRNGVKGTQIQKQFEAKGKEARSTFKRLYRGSAGIAVLITAEKGLPVLEAVYATALAQAKKNKFGTAENPIDEETINHYDNFNDFIAKAMERYNYEEADAYVGNGKYRDEAGNLKQATPVDHKDKNQRGDDIQYKQRRNEAVAWWAAKEALKARAELFPDEEPTTLASVEPMGPPASAAEATALEVTEPAVTAPAAATPAAEAVPAAPAAVPVASTPAMQAWANKQKMLEDQGIIKKQK